MLARARPPKLSFGGVDFSIIPRIRWVDSLNMKDETKGVMRFLLTQLYKERDRNILWRSMHSQGIKAKRTVRSRCQRRIGTALTDVLRERGFDSYGRSLYTGLAALQGSVEIHLNRHSLSMDYAVVKQEMRQLVDFMVQQNRRMPNSPHGGPEFQKAFRSNF